MNKHGYTYSSHQKCELCDELLFIREIFMFPCSHGFHIDCLLHRLRDPVWKYLDDSQLSNLQKLEEQISYYADKNDQNSQMQLEFLKNELDGYVASDCPLCGFCVINSLKESILTNESENEISSWSL